MATPPKNKKGYIKSQKPKEERINTDGPQEVGGKGKKREKPPVPPTEG